MSSNEPRLGDLDILELEKLRAAARARGIKKREHKPAIVPRSSREGPLALSYSQQRLWFLAQLEGVSETYHIPGGVRLRGDLDRAALKGSLDAVYARHEALRSVFPAEGGQPRVQLLAAQGGLPLIEHDLRGVADAQEQLQTLIAQEARAPFDLAHGPLVRGRLIQLSEQEHVLLLTQHHIVSDGWSLGVLLRELGELYRAFAQGHPDPLPALSIQYPDYAAWQSRWLSGVRLQKQADYWREKLAGAPVLLELPTDHARPVRRSYVGARVPIVVEPQLVRELKALSLRHGTTLFMTLLGAWAAVLSRLSGQEELIIGVPSANRGRLQTQGLIGFFVNTLALRIDLAEDPSVGEVLGRICRTTLEAQDHQDLPFEQVVELVQPPRQLNRTPLFQVMFAWQEGVPAVPEFAGLEVEGVAGIEAAYEVAKFDLQLDLSEHEGRIVGGLSYARDLFEEESICRHRGYLLALIEAMVTDERQRLSQIEMLSEPERELLLRTWNATQAPYPQEKLIHELFEEQVQRTPDAVAVVYGEQTLTYMQLNERANQLAHYLRLQGVSAGESVALVMPRSAQALIAQLAILKAAGVYVPIDPEFPTQRQALMVRDCGAKQVIASGRDVRTQADRAGAAASWIDLTEVQPRIEQCSTADPGLLCGEGAIAYVMYTSGSTGEPKGVVIPHRGVIRLVLNNGYARIAEQDCIAHCSNLAFDASTFEIWGALLNGARLLVVPPAVVLDAGQLNRSLLEQQVSVLWLSVGLFNQHRQALRAAFSQLKYLIVGGDALDAAVVREVLTNSAPRHLLNGYGPTECTTFSATYEIAGLDEHATSVPIGRPISNTKIYLLDRYRQPVPLGAVGEIYIGGAGVALGYLNQPELTAERFVSDPFSAEAEARMYRTGDLGRYRADGNLEFLGSNMSRSPRRGSFELMSYGLHE